MPEPRRVTRGQVIRTTSIFAVIGAGLIAGAIWIFIRTDSLLDEVGVRRGVPAWFAILMILVLAAASVGASILFARVGRRLLREAEQSAAVEGRSDRRDGV